jgi:hypothetical protein
VEPVSGELLKESFAKICKRLALPVKPFTNAVSGIATIGVGGGAKENADLIPQIKSAAVIKNNRNFGEVKMLYSISLFVFMFYFEICISRGEYSTKHNKAEKWALKNNNT